LVLVLLAVLLVIILVARSRRPFVPATAVGLVLLGYTNPPGNAVNFALFCISNQSPYPLKIRDSWVEAEGVSYRKARVMNVNLPHTIGPVLKSGESLRLAVGEPSDEPDAAHWRFALSFSRYTWRERWLAFTWKRNLPPWLMRRLRADRQQLLAATNQTTVATQWLTK
jgi:hypothetical protein